MSIASAGSASQAFRRAFAIATGTRGDKPSVTEQGARACSSHEHAGTACEGTECDWLRFALIGGFFFLEYVQSQADLYSKLTHWIKNDNTVNTSESIYPTALGFPDRNIPQNILRKILKIQNRIHRTSFNESLFHQKNIPKQQLITHSNP